MSLVAKFFELFRQQTDYLFSPRAQLFYLNGIQNLGSMLRRVLIVRVKINEIRLFSSLNLT